MQPVSSPAMPTPGAPTSADVAPGAGPGAGVAPSTGSTAVACARVAAAVVASSAALPACFFADPINARPSADIRRIDPEQPYRGDVVRVWAAIDDPDGDPTYPEWRVFACTLEGCDAEPFTVGLDYELVFDAPITTGTGAPAAYARVELDVSDPYGASLVPRQVLQVDLLNRAPVVTTQRQGRLFRGAHPVGAPVTIVAVADDADDPADTLGFGELQLFPPPDATLEDADLSGPTLEVTDDGLQARWELVAHAPGQWEAALMVGDPAGAVVEAMVAVPVAADQPPCLSVAEPAFPPDGARIVLDEPRLFRVLAIDDDLDVYPPPPPGDPLLGAASFRWSRSDGGALTPLGVDGNAVELDPAWYAPGDVLELRVEAVDRLDRDLCDASMASCEAVVGCAQRRTWTVEVR